MIAAVIGIALYLSSGPAALAQPQPIQVIQQDVEITVFNEIETEGYPLFMPTAPEFGPQPPRRRSRTVKSGMALVKDHRIVMNLKKGDNIVRFTDVAASIDPTSVRFVSDTDPLGTTVVEQNFEYDLATAGALLKRYVDKQVTCIAKDGEQYEGYLCSYEDAAIVLADRPPRPDGGDRKTQTITRNDLRAIRLADVPKDLFVKPTLVWKLRTQHPGRHDTTLSYVCGKAKWQADYVAVVTPGHVEDGDRLDLQGWVTIDNRSGSTYRDAKIKLIAGDVNRVTDPWAPPPPVWKGEALGTYLFAGEPISYGFAGRDKQFVEKAFFEYHLYTLSAPSTVKDRQIKQLKLLKANDVKATRRYIFEPAVDAHRVTAQLEFKNEEDNQMGMPLPKGRVRLSQRDADGDLQLIGADKIDHTPRDEELELKLGHAFEVTAERTDVETRRPAKRREIRTVQLRMRNHKDEPIRARFIQHLVANRNWSITESTDPWTREDVNTVHFDFVLDADAERTTTYTVDYQW